MSSAKGRKYPKTRCPECQLEMTEWGVRQHKKSACWGEGVPIINEETKTIWRYWRGKNSHHTPEKQWLLTGAELVQLFEDAGITVNDIGQKSQQYQLARHGDTGHYEMGNCRFITMRENLQEKRVKTTEEWIAHNAGHAKEVSTPHGTYPSLSEAARRIGVLQRTVSRRVKNEREKWKEWHLV